MSENVLRFLHVFGPQLLEGGPKILGRRLSSDHVVMFRGNRPTELGDIVTK